MSWDDVPVGADFQACFFFQRQEKVYPSLTYETSCIEQALGCGSPEKGSGMKIALYQFPTPIRNDIIYHS